MDCYCPGFMALFYVLCGWAIAMLTMIATDYRMDKERKS
jgi:hypothetical protein